MSKQQRIPELTDIEKKAISKIDEILEDVCEPRILPLKNTLLILFVTADGNCFIADQKTRIERPVCRFQWQGKSIPAIKLNKTVFIIPR